MARNHAGLPLIVLGREDRCRVRAHVCYAGSVFILHHFIIQCTLTRLGV